jgi:hypothetical protein
MRIGHASTDGTVAAKQVLIQDISKNLINYKVVLRPKTVELAERSAKACEDGCDNDNILYSMDVSGDKARTTLWNKASKVGFNLSKNTLTETCYADCSSFMAVCAKAGGASISSQTATKWMEKAFTATGEYESLTGNIYFKNYDYLRRGDILVDPGHHTAMVLDSGKYVESIDFSSFSSAAPDINLFITKVNTKNIKCRLKINFTKSDIPNYTFKYEKTYINGNFNIIEITRNLDKEELDFDIDNLDPGTLYFIRVLGYIDGKEVVSTSTFLVRTDVNRPDSVTNIKCKLDDKNMKIHLTFSSPSTWNFADKFYRVFLAVNGNVIDFKDNLINNITAKQVSQQIALSTFGIKSLRPYSSIQIGIQAGYNKQNPIFDHDFPTYCTPIYVVPEVPLVDKIFIKIGNALKQAILYKTKNK